MSSPQHLAWIRRGEPWRLARPLVAVRDRLRHHGYTVYDLGDDSHLDRVPPEHHAPYSEVNWPVRQGVPMPDVVTAIDIMPPARAGLPSLQQLGAQLYRDKMEGHPGAAWIVDMNWGPTSDRTAVRDTWRPSHARTSSGDIGHIHLSCRSDAIDSAAGDGYDPVARLRGLEEEEEELMGQQMLVRFSDAADPAQVWLCDGIHRRPVDAADLAGVGNAQTHQTGLLGPLGNGGQVFVSAGNPDVWGADVRASVKLDATELAAALLADPAFAAALATAAFDGAQRAESE